MDSKREFFFLELNEVLIFIFKKKLNATEALKPKHFFAKKKLFEKLTAIKI